MTARHRLIAVCALLPLVTLACGAGSIPFLRTPTPTPTPTATPTPIPTPSATPRYPPVNLTQIPADDGWTLNVLSQRQVSFETPTAWFTFSVDGDTLGNALSLLANSDFEFGRDAVEEAGDSADYADLTYLALDPSPGDGYVAVTLVLVPVWGWDAHQVAQAVQADFSSLGADEVTLTPVTMGGDSGYRVTYHVEAPSFLNPDETVILQVQQNIIVRGETGYLLSVAAPQSRIADYQDVFDYMLASFEFTE